ncbi:MAG TPA: pyridoxamine 5'-phosphate oxidase family protein [Pseudonocardiaceae bacterium]
MVTKPRHMRQLRAAESLRLLASLSVGRIAFTADALPQIRVVNHVVDNGDVIIRSHVGAAIISTNRQVVCYEADAVDPETRAGWSVIVTGIAQVIDNPSEIARYEGRVEPWLEDVPMDYVIRIRPEIVTGYRIVDE